MQQIKKKIMVIDDNVANLNLARIALEEQFELFLLPSGEIALTSLDRITPDLILLDVDMPKMNGFEVLRQIKQAAYPINSIPVIFLTGKKDPDSECLGLDIGAVDYITKPFSFALLLKRVEIHLQLQNYSKNLEKMVQEKTKVITELQYSIVHVMSDMVERRDGSTGGHLMRTQQYLQILLDEVKKHDIYSDELRNVDINIYIRASQLHDIGKISIPDSILLKEGQLSPIEFEVMKQHAILGEDAIHSAMASVQETEFLEIAAAFAGAHHERWDGTGYPRALREREIPIEGRLMAIADVYDALISQRPYKGPMPYAEARKIILEGKGTHFDPLLIPVFEKASGQFEAIAQEHKDEAPFKLLTEGRLGDEQSNTRTQPRINK